MVRLATRTDEVVPEPTFVVFPPIQLTANNVMPLALVATVKVAEASLACTAAMVGALGTETTAGGGVATEVCGALLPPPPPPQLVSARADAKKARDLHNKMLFNECGPTFLLSGEV